MEEQKFFFEVLKTKIPGQYSLTDTVEELLDVSTNAAYRRIRGETELTFSELLLLCRKFNVSMDDLFNVESNQGALFRYAPVSFTEPESYITYIKRLLESFTFHKNANEKEIDITAQDIPFFYFLDYPELMFFKLYAWNDTVTRAPQSYNEFCSKLEKNTIISVYKQMSNVWKQVPSREIWTNQTLDTILRLLEYYYEIGVFEDKKNVVFLLNQLMEVMNDISKYAGEGYKGNFEKTPFYLYLCNVDFENNFMLIKRDGELSCTIRLYTVNSIITDHKALCSETAKWIEDLISKSTLISKASARERLRFFQSSKNKIEGLVDKIDKD
jgi:hypothetical protein